MQILLAILALSFLIIIHELGHFTAAKLSGIKVHEFALFMGPKIFSVRRGDTVYSVRLIPLGGFVRMEGEEEASEDQGAYNKKPLYIRAAVAAAGPLMNLAAAVIILSVVFATVGFRTNVISEVAAGSPAYEAGIRPGDRVTGYAGKKILHPMDMGLFMFVNKGAPSSIEVTRGGEKLEKTITPRIIPAQKRYILGFVPKESEGADSNLVSDIVPNSNAAKAGLMIQDRIVALNGQKVASRQDIGKYMEGSKGETVEVTVVRNGGEVRLSVTPTFDQSPEQVEIGLDYENRSGNAAEIVNNALVYTISTVRSVYYSVVWLVTGAVSLNQMMGPVGIVTTIGDVVKQSPTASMVILSLLNITAFISINLGVMNLIPFPALDGSKLLLIVIEAVRKKAIPPEKEAFISLVGFVLLIMLMLFTTYNDILRRVSGG